MSQATSARPARPFALVVSFAAIAFGAVACTPAVRPDGDACIKDYDCLSGVCDQQVCVARPTLLDAEVKGEAGSSTGDAGSDAADATMSADTGSPPVDSGMMQQETGTQDASADSPPEASDDGSSDGATDSGATDSPTD